MTDLKTNDLIQGLASNLEPVRCIPRLRVMLASIFGVWVLALLLAAFFSALRPDLMDQVHHNLAFGSIWLGLGFLAAGTALTALASVIPGRECATRSGQWMACFGLLLAVGVSSVQWVEGLAFSTVTQELGGALHCFSHTCLFALVPVALVLGFLFRGWFGCPWKTAISCAGAALLMGSFLTHSMCTANRIYHLLMGHVLIPVIAAFLVAIPIGIFLRYRAKKGENPSA